MDAERGVLGLDAENAARLAAAYEKAVSILSFNDTSRLAPASRAALLKAMLRHSQLYGYDESRLALAGLASAPCEDDRSDIIAIPALPAARGAALRRARGIRLPRPAP